jgi:hypothetical protein
MGRKTMENSGKVVRVADNGAAHRGAVTGERECERVEAFDRQT